MGIDKVVDVPVVRQRQVPSVQKVQKYVEIPQIQYVDKVIDVPMTKTIEVLSVQTVEKIVDIPQTQIVERIVEVPQIETVNGQQSTVNIPTAPMRQTAPAEIVEVQEMGMPLPAEMIAGVTMAAPAPTVTYAAPAPAV